MARKYVSGRTNLLDLSPRVATTVDATEESTQHPFHSRLSLSGGERVSQFHSRPRLSPALSLSLCLSAVWLSCGSSCSCFATSFLVGFLKRTEKSGKRETRKIAGKRGWLTEVVAASFYVWLESAQEKMQGRKRSVHERSLKDTR